MKLGILMLPNMVPHQKLVLAPGVASDFAGVLECVVLALFKHYYVIVPHVFTFSYIPSVNICGAP